jgi:hypothetical protein
MLKSKPGNCEPPHTCQGSEWTRHLRDYTYIDKYIIYHD